MPFSIIRSLASQAWSARKLYSYVRIYNRFREFTMIPRRAYVQNLQLAAGIAHIPGSIVECGVWRGGMSGGLAQLLGPQRKYYLFDSFEGLPAAKEVDGESALEWQKNTSSPRYFDNCTAPEDFARRAMALSGAQSVEFVKGWFDQTLPAFKSEEPIALLRLDGDWYDSTMVCLENLFDRVAPNGLIILDDYHFWDGCSRAVHDFLSKRSATERIRSLGDICYLRKNPPAQPKASWPSVRRL
jgi:O-methyltransferase